jgi:hypothetical protein
LESEQDGLQVDCHDVMLYGDDVDGDDEQVELDYCS